MTGVTPRKLAPGILTNQNALSLSCWVTQDEECRQTVYPLPRASQALNNISNYIRFLKYIYECMMIGINDRSLSSPCNYISVNIRRWIKWIQFTIEPKLTRYKSSSIINWRSRKTTSSPGKVKRACSFTPSGLHCVSSCWTYWSD